MQEQLKEIQESTILLVEDNTINQEVIKGLLENSLIQVDTAINGQIGYEMFEKNQDRYKLILMDIQMPLLDGFETTKQIRQLDKAIPIIALTANTDPQTIEKTKQYGMDQYLGKPIDANKLYGVLLKYLANIEIDLRVNEEKIESILSLDIQKGLFYLNNNEKIYKKLLENFIQEYGACDASFFQLEDFALKIHALKGLSLNLGALKLHSIVEALQKQNSKDFQNDFLKELHIVLQEVHHYLNQQTSTLQNDNQLTQIDPIAVDEVFKQLLVALESNRIKKINSLLDTLKTFDLEKQKLQKLQTIQEAVAQFDFQKAIDLLQDQTKNSKIHS